ncbi:coiled-coil domain-containing protein 107 isoform X1 [Cricetulus griseus]|uniref:Coiled-coil domain containing 107 n=1 Tax=Cricetulus griseus TaxID=10029 RepID=A0A3L7I380_CRIGR|nr:coiled-coil domain-containing protein 107 isoform X1 [Cricetulus griseus]XP_027259046.1 coiled-coil domain-containing protein 107 isoform X2 [Cricetulus griseus]ERE83226.1 coiled-coil domain-containing protein [Cricetulus griseus]
MAGAGPVSSVLGLLLVSALFGVLGERPSPDQGAHSERRSQVGPGSTEPRRRPPPKDQRERARAGALPLGALYTAAVVAFVLYKCLQGPDEAAILQEEKNKKKSLQSEQQLMQLTQQLAQTEQHLNNLMTQLDPLFERVTTLVGTQRELLNMKLKTIHQLLQDCNPDLSVHIPGKRSGGDGLETEAGKLEQADLSLTKATIPFPKHLGKEDQQGAGDCEAWEGPINWSPDSWNLAPSWEVEQGLRRRWHKTVTKDPARNGEQPLKG